LVTDLFSWHAILTVWSLPVIGAFIGWVTNYIAIRMLFRPRNPVRILGFNYQAPLPRRQAEIAERVGVIVEEQLLTVGDLRTEVVTPETTRQLMETIDREVTRALKEKRARLPRLARLLLGNDILRVVKNLLVGEVEARLPSLMEHSFETVSRNLSIQGIVARKVAAFELERLEEVIFQLASQELRLIEVLGGVLGFLIGSMQVIMALV
jgi:uncharacterized membrane protein YheB (UPF0754 family)